jgi:hypothetical protein
MVETSLRYIMLVAIALAAALASCGKRSDPAFTPASGDLAVFLVNAVSNRAPGLKLSLAPVTIETTWHSRVLDQRHESGEYLEDREALQVATVSTNFTAVESLFTSVLGPASLPLRREKSGWQHMGWRETNHHLSIWLKQVGEQCQIEIVSPQRRTKR